MVICPASPLALNQ